MGLTWDARRNGGSMWDAGCNVGCAAGCDAGCNMGCGLGCRMQQGVVVQAAAQDATGDTMPVGCSLKLCHILARVTLSYKAAILLLLPVQPRSHPCPPCPLPAKSPLPQEGTEELGGSGGALSCGSGRDPLLPGQLGALPSRLLLLLMHPCKPPPAPRERCCHQILNQGSAHSPQTPQTQLGKALDTPQGVPSCPG